MHIEFRRRQCICYLIQVLRKDENKANRCRSIAENNNHAVSRQASIYICCSSKYFDPLYGSSYLVTFYHYCNNIFLKM